VERKKLEVKPGITGLSQVSGRNLLEAHEKWSIDAQYAKEAGLVKDLFILASTILKVIRREGIYKKTIS
jgi:lipopolysaccharide/colanic/teichoic acid biosynthesis glycosyltransferase